MIHLPRRYFHQAMNEKRWSKEKKMGGPIYQEFVRGEYDGKYRILTQEEINGYVTKDAVQETIDSLNSAIDRLDKIINEMKENCECKN